MVGHHVRTFPAGDEAVTEHNPPAYYTSAGDFAYGGIIASLIDCHSAGTAAIFWMRYNQQSFGEDPAPRFLTARLEIDYLAPTPLGPVRMVGRLEEMGERKVIVTTDYIAGDTVTAQGRAVMVRIAEES